MGHKALSRDKGGVMKTIFSLISFLTTLYGRIIGDPTGLYWDEKSGRAFSEKTSPPLRETMKPVATF